MHTLLPLTVAALALALMAFPAAGHDVATSDAQSPLLAPGQSYNETAHATGIHAYHCHVHPGMMGTLVVLGGVDPAGPQARRIAIYDDGNATHLRAMGFHDPLGGGNTTTVHLGDRVEWTNEGTLAHDVHIAWPAPADTGAFELWVAAGLVVALTAIFFAAQRV
jgi:plastocyanin